MVAIKLYTDINQSKKLAEILSPENADMCYPYNRHLNEMYGDIPYVMGYKKFNKDTDIPCWSLAALLDILESEIDGENGETYKLNIEKNGTWWDIWYSEEYDEEDSIEAASSEELIDVCVSMILKLKERSLI